MAQFSTHDTTKPIIATEDARQGEAPGIVRYVLGISLTLAVIAGVLLYLAWS